MTHERAERLLKLLKDLVIFDKPKELDEFGLNKAPMSWRYVEVEE